MAMVGSMQQEQEKAACSRCSSDTRVHVGELFLHYRKLQELADSLESRLPMVGKLDVGRQLRWPSQGGRWQHKGLGWGLPQPPCCLGFAVLGGNLSLPPNWLGHVSSLEGH